MPRNSAAGFRLARFFPFSLGCFVLLIVEAFSDKRPYPRPIHRFPQTLLPRRLPLIPPLPADASPARPSAMPAVQAPVVQPPVVARAPEQPLAADDVSWLFPAPTKESDLANLIAMSDLTVP